MADTQSSTLNTPSIPTPLLAGLADDDLTPNESPFDPGHQNNHDLRTLSAPYPDHFRLRTGRVLYGRLSKIRALCSDLHGKQN